MDKKSNHHRGNLISRAPLIARRRQRGQNVFQVSTSSDPVAYWLRGNLFCNNTMWRKTSHQMRNQPKMALKPWPLTQSQMILKNILLKPTPFSFQCTYCKTFRTYLRNNSNPLCTSFETPFTLLWQKNKFKFLYLSIIHPGPLPPFLHPHLTLGWDFVLTRRRAQNRKRNLHLIRAVLSYNTPKNEFRKLQHFVPLSLTFWRNSNSNVKWGL